MDSITVWKASLSNRSEATKKQYFHYFKRFQSWVEKTADELRQLKFQEDQTAKPWERNHVENLLRQFLESVEDEYTCSTRKAIYNAAKSFFSANGMQLNLTPNDKPSGCAFGSRVPTREEIREMVNATEHLRNRSLILFLKDSGLRLSDVAQLKWKNLKDYGEGFMSCTIQTKKGKTKARCFVGPECTSILRLYKEKRLRGTQKVPPEEKIEEHRVFALYDDFSKPLRPRMMSTEIGRVIALAGVEGVTPHGLRKFWEQNMHVEKLAYQKQMNGRALNDVERAYFWKETEELFEMYKANYHSLTIAKQEFREVEERLRREYEREIKALKNRIYELERKENEMKQIRDDLDELRKFVKEQLAQKG